MNMFNLLPISTPFEMAECSVCKGCTGCDGGCQGCSSTASAGPSPDFNSVNG